MRVEDAGALIQSPSAPGPRLPPSPPSIPLPDCFSFFCLSVLLLLRLCLHERRTEQLQSQLRPQSRLFISSAAAHIRLRGSLIEAELGGIGGLVGGVKAATGTTSRARCDALVRSNTELSWWLLAPPLLVSQQCSFTIFGSIQSFYSIFYILYSSNRLEHSDVCFPQSSF